MQYEEVDIRSETQVALTDDMTEHIKQLSNKVPDTIILRTRRRNYPIKVTNFAKCSEKVKMLVQRQEIPPAIDLSCYNIGAVRTMTDFIAGVDERNLRLGDNILTDLLQLARIFRMRQLTAMIVEHIIEKVQKGSPSNLLLAMNLVSSDWSLFLHINEASAMIEAAAASIDEVTNSTLFNMLPAAVLVMLYSRCDVNVTSEIELSLKLIHWLKKTVRTDDDAVMLFSCIRTPFLSSKDRDLIREKCNGLPQSQILFFLRSPKHGFSSFTNRSGSMALCTARISSKSTDSSETPRGKEKTDSKKMKTYSPNKPKYSKSSKRGGDGGSRERKRSDGRRTHESNEGVSDGGLNL